MGRLVLGVLAGLLALFVLVAGVELLSTLLFPLPPGLDPTNTAQLADYLRSGSVPALALVLVVLAYTVGAFGGAFVATRIAHQRGLTPALIIGQLCLVFVIWNLVQLPHPLWMAVLSLLVPMPAAWAGGRGAGAKPAKRSRRR